MNGGGGGGGDSDFTIISVFKITKRDINSLIVSFI